MLAGALVSCRSGSEKGAATTGGDLTDDTGGSQTAESTPAGSGELPTGAPEAEYTSVWLSAGYEKIKSKDEMPAGASQSFNVCMAKNEKESCTISIRSDKRLLGLDLIMKGTLPEGVSVELLKEFMIPVSTNDWPDPLVALNQGFSVNSKSTQNVLIRFTTTAEAKAGNYSVDFDLNNEDGQTIATVTVELTVWELTYPETLTSFAFSDIDVNDLAKFHKIDVDDEEFEELYKSYYDLLLDYGICAYELPYDILDPRADEYMSDPRVKAFLVADSKSIAEITDDELVAIYEKLKTNPEWLAKATIYPFDEPTELAHLQTIKERCERLIRLCPDIKRVVPFYQNPDYSADLDLIEFLSEYTQVYSPKSYAYIDNNIYRFNTSRKDQFGSFYDRMEAFKEEGYQVWWYVCWEPGYPYCNMYVNEQGINHRVLFWQQSMYGVSAFLYWEANHWGSIKKGDPWVDMATVPGLSPDVYGDGCIMYNGSKLNMDTGVPSLRMDIIRDGLEDYELLEMARATLGDDYITRKIKSVTLDLVNHTSSVVTFERVRNEIAADLINALAEK